MYKVITNESGTRSIEVSTENLETIRKYKLFQLLFDSNGIVTETVLEKLRLNLRSMLVGGADKDLVDLCIDVFFHSDMKAPGLSNLLALYQEWSVANPEMAE
ncbi:MAG: hypothetical protein MJY58_06960 [Bacteroidaceae bacterium]|nr:hypothetical protein [Bacteroidaceae bacterium]